MSNPYLPPEILDYIVDLLRPCRFTDWKCSDALKQCCLVSKSWIPRTRKHLFAEIRLYSKENLESWKKIFPDPSISPAYFANSLHVGCPRAITAADAERDSWLTGFAHIVHLGVETQDMYPGESLLSLVPFRRFSPVIKSLHLGSIDLPPSRIFNFVLSSPLLEDLTVTGYGLADDGDGSDGPSTVDQPSNPPLLTGSLKLLYLDRGLLPIAARLLTMPGGIHFRKLILECHYKEDLSLAWGLVMRCSHTLESLDVTCCKRTDSMSTSIVTSIVLSEATRLKDLTFRVESSPRWVVIALRTITAKHRDLRQISISLARYGTSITYGGNPRQDIGESTLGEWLELDRLLGQLWESYSIPPKIACSGLGHRDEITRTLVGHLFPETTKGGTANLVRWFER